MTRLTFISFLIVVGCFLVFVKCHWMWYINQARRRGIYPPKDKATMYDVRRLIIEDEPLLAELLYCEIFKCSRKTARQAVNELAQNIKTKKS